MSIILIVVGLLMVMIGGRGTRRVTTYRGLLWRP